MSAAAISTAAKVVKVVAPPPPDRSWSIEEAAYVLNIGATTVRELEQAGKLPALPRIGRRMNFDPKVVEAFRVGGAQAAIIASAKLSATTFRGGR